MKRFLHGHATHPDALMALALAAAQIEAQRQRDDHASAPTLGWLYFTDHFAAHAAALLAEVRRRWPGVQWVGASGAGIAASGVEYFDEPAVALMLAELPTERFRVFSGARPLGDFDAHTAQVHADPATDDLAELIGDMSERTRSGYLFGGLASSASNTRRPLQIADELLSGGLSGVAFDAGVALVSRVTQGCQPVGPTRRISASERNVATLLDGEPALDCLLRDLSLDGVEPRAALPRLRQILVGLTDADAADGSTADADATLRDARDARDARDGRESRETPEGGESRESRATRSAFGNDTRVRHLVGLDPGRRGIAVSDMLSTGASLAFCSRNVDAARRDLVRICAELRDEVEPETLPLAAALALREAGDGDGAAIGASAGLSASMTPGIAGAIYVSCAGRGGAHFGGPSAELQLVRHALGDVPLVGFFAAGEIARRHLYGYTGVLTVFRA